MNLDPRVIEEVLVAHPDVAEAAGVGEHERGVAPADAAQPKG